MRAREMLQKKIDPSLPLANGQEELFATLYVTDADLMGNGVQSYIEAFDIEIKEKGDYLRCVKAAAYLLRKGSVCARINHFIESAAFNDQFVDKQHAFLIAQHTDMRTKMAAIKEYNALKGRVKQKLELSFKDKTDKDLDDERAKLEQELKEAEAMERELDSNEIDASKGINPDALANLSDEQRATVTNSGPTVHPQAAPSTI